MPRSRPSLAPAAIDQQPLVGRTRPKETDLPLKFPPQTVSAAPETLPVPVGRERSTNIGLRMPNSLLDQLDEICEAREIDRTALLLYLIRMGLRSPFAQTKEVTI